MTSTNRKKGKGLGRGLDLLLGETSDPGKGKVVEEPEISGHPRTLPVESLKPASMQPRQHFDDESINELAESIKSHGLLQPVLVRPKGNRYEIVAGERRWRAAQKAQLHDIPVIIGSMTDEETSEVAIIENVQRVDLNPMEEARAYHQLVDVYGKTREDIAARVGKSRSHITNIMRLIHLPERARASLLAGSISMGHARALLGSDDPDAVCSRIIENGWSVRQTEKYIKNHPGENRADDKSGRDPVLRPPPENDKSADTKSLECNLVDILGVEVEIRHTKKGNGVLSLKYADLEQLDYICRRLMGSRL